MAVHTHNILSGFGKELYESVDYICKAKFWAFYVKVGLLHGAENEYLLLRLHVHF